MNLIALTAFVGAISAGVLSCAVMVQRRRSHAPWLFASGMLLLAIESLFSGLSATAHAAGEVIFWQRWRLVVMAALPATWLAFSAVYARANPAQALSRWRLSFGLGLLVPVLIAGTLFSKLVQLEVPKGASSAFLVLGPGARLLHMALLLGAILLLVNLERTFRSAVGTMRWRIKFMVLGIGVLFTARVYTSSQSLLFRNIDLSFQAVNSVALILGCLLIVRALFRAGHFEVTVYPSQQVLHNSFTILLAGVYLFIVGVLAKLVSTLGGDAAFQLKALLILVSLILLSMLLLSDRVRMRTKRFVSRHFQRPLYDYRTVWRTFTEGTARKVDQTELSSAIIKLLSEIFEALSVNLWLMDDKKQNFVFTGSTSILSTKAGEGKIEPADTAEIKQALIAHPDPIDIDASTEAWAAAVRRSHPDQFRHGANRVCVPLISGGELLGFVTLGDRVGGQPFSLQDFDLLKAVADQASASILNMQLGGKLSQAKQLEAFQTMSAFFVHDLKNTASTLSLMLKNLPIHYDDPQFREDALRGIGKTVTHINDLITRLSVLRHEMGIKPVEADLNKLVEETLAACHQVDGFDVRKDLEPLPRVRMDPSQIEKVITNLLINAREAIGPTGSVRVHTARANGWAALEVSDDGCGMSREFIENRLFRPFETTKKKGIGIGMFHCKMILDAHSGRIEVESEPGRGTTFRILLPLGNTA